MFEAPTEADLDRNLSTIAHDARHRAQRECLSLANSLAPHGLVRSGNHIARAIELLDTIHRNSLDETMQLLASFAPRMKLSPKEIVACARPHLTNLGNLLLEELPSAGLPNAQQKVRSQYHAVFNQCLDNALRDFEIGFVGGYSLVRMNEPPAANEKKTDLIILKPGIWGMSFDLAEAGRRLRAWWKKRR